MWFKNIASWETNKLRAHHLCYISLYLIFSLVIPCIIIGINYKLIESSSVRLTGIGLILLVCITVFLFKGVQKVLLKLPQETYKEQCLKFTILMLYNLILPILALVLVHLIKQNVILACDTLTKCISSFIVAVIIEYTTLKYTEVEFMFRREAKHELEVDKRKALLTK